jgi:putative peptidoglycan binding protein
MKRAFAFALMTAMLWLAWGADAATPAARKKTPAKKGAAGTAAARKKTPARRPSTTWRNRQLAPSPQRYREIQDALAAKGYLPGGDANGAWNQSSIDALKKFQAEQNLEPTGKINSLSLIALGLGPKRETTAAAAPPKVPQ